MKKIHIAIAVVVIGTGLLYKRSVQGMKRSAEESVASQTILIPGAFDRTFAFANGRITPNGLLLKLTEEDGITHEPFREILADSKGALLAVVKTARAYFVYEGTVLTEWFKRSRRDPTIGQPIEQVLYYLTPSASEPLSYIGDFSQIDSNRILKNALTIKTADAQFQMRLGAAFHQKQDFKSAEGWLLKAATQNNREAMRLLGSLYAQGALGVPQDLQAAKRWYTQAAALNDSAAMTRLGLLYLPGHHGFSPSSDLSRENFKTAEEWLTKAINLGDQKAMLYLGLMYAQAPIGPQGLRKAYELYERLKRLNFDPSHPLMQKLTDLVKDYPQQQLQMKLQSRNRGV